MPATFTLSAFGDEIAADLEEQLQVLRDLRIGYLDLRGAWGKNVLALDNSEVARVRDACKQYGIAVSCMGSPIGKSPIVEPVEHEVANLTRIFQIAEAVGTRRVRVFSFYPPDTSSNARYDEHVAEATSRLTKLADLARREGFVLLLENEKDIVGDTLARCHALITAVNSPSLRFLWDPANFVQIGEDRQVARGWPTLGPYTAYVHVKDALLHDGSVVPAGEGDGQVADLLARLRVSEYQGFLALEPHLAVAGPSGGFSGADNMARAAAALRKLVAQVGCVEVAALS